MITDESVISRDNSSYRLKVTRNVYDKIIISVFCKQRAEFPWRLRPIHTRDFAPGACSRGTLREQSSSACINEFMVILHPQEQNFRPAKCSTIFNRLNIWQKAPGANWANLKTLPRVCTDTCKMSLDMLREQNLSCVSTLRRRFVAGAFAARGTLRDQSCYRGRKGRNSLRSVSETQINFDAKLSCRWNICFYTLLKWLCSFCLFKRASRQFRGNFCVTFISTTTA